MENKQKQLTLQDVIDDVKNLWFGDNGLEAQGYIGLCLSGENGELIEVEIEPMEIILNLLLTKHIGKTDNMIKKELRSGAYKENLQKKIESELPDILFYWAQLVNIRGINVNKMWNEKMAHNERKYNRPLKKRPYDCSCETCVEWDLKHKKGIEV